MRTLYGFSDDPNALPIGRSVGKRIVVKQIPSTHRAKVVRYINEICLEFGREE
jgi:hypothetical protein